MHKTLKEIASLIGGEVVGDADTVITGVSGIKEAKKGDITFLANPKYISLIDQTHASAVITSADIRTDAIPLIHTTNPSLAFTKVVALVSPKDTKHPKGIHPTAVISKTAKLAKGVAVGAYAVIEENACIADNAVIYAHCYIGHDVKIGKDTVIYPNVSVREKTEIGERVIIQSGTVVGSDGFGYITVEGKHIPVPQVGSVVIEDDVDIGANATIDRARFNKTIIRRGTKIDNLVQIAHNVVVGENSIIVSQAGVSGSTTLGKNVIIAGQAGLVGHIEVGDDCVIMAQAGVSKSIPEKTMVWGYPARPHMEAKKINACVGRLPKLYETIKELKAKIKELESRLQGK